MSTTTIPFVRSVIAASTAAGSRFSVCGSTSANTGRPPSKMKQFAVATKAIGDVITSSPSCTPAMWHSMCSPAVPLETAAAYGAPTRSAKSSSNRSIAGPSESRPERRTSRRSSSSRSSTYGRERGTRVSVLTPPRAPRCRSSRTRATVPSARSCRGTCRGTPSGAPSSPARVARSRGRRPPGSASPRQRSRS